MRSLLKAVLIILLLAGVAVFLLGWWGTGRFAAGDRPQTPASNRAREVGAEVGERAGAAAAEARRAVADGSVTAKIKAKLALDDTVRAREIDVDTDGSTVTVSGTVGTVAERDRVLQLARETAGVTAVVDRLRVGP